jgi:hypothetical protein
MKKNICIALFALTACLTTPMFVSAEPTAAATETGIARYEYAIVKWDGPDRLYYNLPNKFELVHLKEIGVTIPKEANEEEFCLSVAANKMSKDGWEPINLNSRRILFRRSIK